MEWLKRMTDALDLIEERLTEPLDIGQIARAACASPFHFQRMFHMVTGMTVYEYVRKRRLTLAAQELAMTSAKVVDVALKYGYETPESFAKAFRKAHGIAPSAARNPGAPLKAFPRIAFHLSLRGDKEMEYKIMERESFTVVGKAKRVSCVDGENLRQVPEFWVQCGKDGTEEKLLEIASPNSGDMLGICTDFGGDEFTYLIAVEADADAADPAAGLVAREIPAHTWAVFTSVGPIPAAIQDVWQRIYKEWLPATGYEHAEGPELEVYPPGDASAADYRCEIWLPIVKK